MTRRGSAAAGVLACLALAAASAHGQIDLATPQLYSTDNAAVWDVEFGDFDRDGDLDMAVANTPVNNGRISVWLNDGHGAFGNPAHYMTAGAIGGPTPTGLAVTDLDQDGWPDIVASLFSPGSSILVLRNAGDGTFGVTQTVYSGNATGVAAGDLDGDGHPDVISSNSQISGGRAKVFLNDGTGTLLPGIEHAVAFSPRNVSLGDFDADGDRDLALPALAADVVTVLWNDGAAGFSERTDHPVGIDPSAAATGDLDGDGIDDLAVSSTGAQFTSDVSVLISDGAGGFHPQVTYDVGYDAGGIVAADLDLDGDLDLSVVVTPQARVFVLENLGAGVLAAPVTFPCGVPGDVTHSLTAADVDGDGRLDLAAGNMGINETAAVLLNTTPPPAPPWTDLGGGSAGAFGLPVLSGSGPLEGGSPVSLTLTGAPPSVPVLLWIASSPTPTPLFGGTLHAFPFLTQFLMFTDGSGSFGAGALWPSGIAAGTEFWFQFLIHDVSVPGEIILSNGLKGTAH